MSSVDQHTLQTLLPGTNCGWNDRENPALAIALIINRLALRRTVP